jgi:hypothetical protein
MLKLLGFVVSTPVAFFMGAVLAGVLTRGREVVWLIGGVLAVLVFILVLLTDNYQPPRSDEDRR